MFINLEYKDYIVDRRQLRLCWDACCLYTSKLVFSSFWELGQNAKIAVDGAEKY